MTERVTHIGVYRIERELLREERRTVYQGWQTALNHPVQITQLTPEAPPNAEFVARWKGAARDLRDPGHPQLPRILDAQFSGEQPYLVESYIVADTLADQLDRERDLGSSLRLVASLADALAYAHQRGWAHGQLRAEYVRVMEDGSAYVLDLPWQAVQRAKGDTAAMQQDVQALAQILQVLREPVAGAMPAQTGRLDEDMGLLAAWLAQSEAPEAGGTAVAVAPLLLQIQRGEIADCEHLAAALRPVLPGARAVASSVTPPPNSTFVTPPPAAASRPQTLEPQIAPLTPPPQLPLTPPPSVAPPSPHPARGLVGGALIALVVVAALAVGAYLLCRTGALPFCASCNQGLIAQYVGAARVYADKGSWQEAQRELQSAQAECAACNAGELAACAEIEPLATDVACRLQVETAVTAGEKLLNNGDACTAMEKLEEAAAAAEQCQADATLARSFLARNSDGGAYTLCALERLALAQTEANEQERNLFCGEAHTLLGKARAIRPSAALITQHYTRAERFAALQASYTAQQWDAAADALEALQGAAEDSQYCGYLLGDFRFEIFLGLGDELSRQENYPAALNLYQQAEQLGGTLTQQNRVAQAMAAIPASALTPSATPALTPTPATTPTLFVVSQGANIRACPSTNCRVEQQLAAGATLPVICSVAETDGAWYRLDLGATTGWARADVITLQGQPPACLGNEVTPTPTAPPQPTCQFEPQGRFAQVWQQHRSLLGCPLGGSTQSGAATERFQGGRMIWRENTDRIYVLYDGGGWTDYPDISIEGAPEPNRFQAPPSLFVPVRGFGAIWHDKLSGPGSRLGWATEAEYWTPIAVQDFQTGILIDLEGRILVLGNNGARWLTQ